MIASAAILHIARNGDVSLTTTGLVDLTCVMVMLALSAFGIWFRS